jgi:hypothetical protein
MQKSKVYQQFEKLEQSKNQLLNRLASINPSVLQFYPAKDKWSIIQIIFHLNSSESNSVKYMSKKSLGGSSVPKSTMMTSLKSLLLSTALRFFKWKKPVVLPDPPGNLYSNEVMNSWNGTRIQLKQLLEQLSEDMLNRNIFRHPTAGRMNISHALTFMQEHFDHHLKQIEERILLAKKSS